MRARTRHLLILSLLVVGIAFPASAHATAVDVTRGIVGYGTVKAGTAADCTSPQGMPGGTTYNCGAIDATQYDTCTTLGADGSFSCSITLTAQVVDAGGWRFDHWTGDCSGTSTTCTLPTSDTECDPDVKPPCHTTYDGPYTPVAHFADTRAPTTTFSTAPAPNSVVYSDTQSQTFTWTTNEDGENPTFACRRDAGSFSACSSGINWSSISDGIHDFCVHGTDASGLLGADACRHWEQETNPTASITSHPPTVTSSNSATFGYTSNKAGHPADGSTLSYQCKLDGGSFGACPSSYSSLADGSHTFQVQAVFTAALGGGAHTSPAASYTWTVDATPPTLNFTSGPSDGSVVVDSSGHAAFGWNASDATTGVSNIQCKLDAADYGPCTSATSEVLDSVADGEHTLSVKATDGAGNQRVQSVTWEQETPADTIIDSGPADGAVTNTKTAHFTFHSSKTDAPVTFQCAIDSNTFAACTGATSEDLSGLSDGSHTFQVRAVFTASIDGSQHAGAAASRAWTVDTTPHLLKVTKSGTGQGTVTSSPAGISCGSACSHAFVRGTTVTLTAHPASGSRLTGWSGSGCSGTGTCKVTMSANRTVTATFTRIPPPNTTITSHTVRSAKRTASFSFTGSGGVAPRHFKCKLDGAAYASCTSPKAYSRLKVGSHTFRVEAVDARGIVDPTPASYSFKVTR